MRVCFKICLAVLLCLCVRVDASPGKEGAPWRIVYFEGGAYGEYADSLHGLLTALNNAGWLSEAPGPDLKTSIDLWSWAAEQESPFLQFDREGYYTIEWDRNRRAEVRERLYGDLAEGKADMVLGMGTWAGIELKDEDPGVPVVIMAVSDAIASGLFYDDKPGNPPWLHVRMDPGRDERQVRIFHDTVGFTTLGVVFKDSVEGRSYAALDTVAAVARDRNFRVGTCSIPDGEDLESEEHLLLKCYRELSEEVDAFYVTALRALNRKTFPVFLEHTLKKRIPTFSQQGSHEVHAGLLMSISQANFMYVGDFTARTIKRILEGEPPGGLPMVFEDPPIIAINLKTATRIAYDVPVDVLGASDQIFLDIKPMQ